MRRHIVKSFDDHLDKLNDKLFKMGNELLDRMNLFKSALKNDDIELMDKVIASDNVINSLYHKINRLCINLISLRQPMAVDLRFIFSAIHISKNMERIGDNLVNGCSNYRYIVNESSNAELKDCLLKMVEVLSNMLTEIIDCLIKSDVERAILVGKMDDEVDKMYRELVNLCLNLSKREPDSIENISKILMIASSLERFGDHIVNISYYIYFTVNGIFYGEV